MKTRTLVAVALGLLASACSADPGKGTIDTGDPGGTGMGGGPGGMGTGVELVKAWDGLTLFTQRSSVTNLSPGVVVNGQPRRFDDERFRNLEWVGHARAGERWILLLDSGVEAPAWEVTVVVSDDHGASWQIGAVVRKPYYFARVSGFAFDTPSRGCIDLVLDDDYGAGVTPGHYESCSEDAGRTWSAFQLAESH